MSTSLTTTLRRTQRRVQLTRAVQRAGLGLTIGAVGGLGLIVLDRAMHAGWPWWVPAGCAALGLAGGFIAPFLRRPASSDMAVLLDRRLGLKDRVATAEAIQRGVVQRDGFAELVERDATRMAAGIAPSHVVPWRFGRVWLAGLGLLAVVGISDLYLPPFNWSSTRAESISPEELAALEAARDAVAEALAREIEREQREAGDDLSERQRDELAMLDELARQLREAPPDDPESFRQARDEAAARLNERADQRAREAEREQRALDALAEQFERLQPPDTNSAARPLGESLQQSEFQQAVEALNQLEESLDDMTDAESESLANDLNQMADSLDRAAQADREKQAERERRMRETLRRQGLDEQTIDEMLARENGPEARELTEQGLDPETARNLARELQRAAEERRANEDAGQTTQQISQRLREMSEDMREPSQQRQSQQRLSSAEELQELLDMLNQRCEECESSGGESERLRAAARGIAETLTPGERERFDEWAREMQRESGDSSSSMASQESPGTSSGQLPGSQAVGNTWREGNQPLPTAQTESLDLRGGESGSQVLAEIFDHRRFEGAPGVDRPRPGAIARDAARSAERAVSNATIHRRYHDLIKRYFDQLPSTLEEAAGAPGTTETSGGAESGGTGESGGESGGTGGGSTP